ncbi:MAG TPA: 50S ribosomal protein L29 [Candidatus Handelsmanbacteria bacterium]|nr:50S ribosomal protein L29 [Candidatus Handelsmanbacteria bacterium]
MKVSELREMNADDVKNKLEELHEESFNLRFQHVSGQLTSPIRLRQVRRDIAKVHTVLKEHVLGVRALAGGE